MNRNRLLWSLLPINSSVFIYSSLLLPKAGTFFSSGPVSYYLNSRTDWHIAFVATSASILFSVGIYLALTSMEQNR